MSVRVLVGVVPLLWLSIGPLSAQSAVSCDEAGWVEWVHMETAVEGSIPIAIQRDGGRRVLGQPVAGVPNVDAPVYRSPQGLPLIASFIADPPRAFFAIWLADGRVLRRDGGLVDVSFAPGPAAAMLLSWAEVEEQGTGVRIDAVLDADGSERIRRTTVWDPDDHDRLRFSEAGDVLYVREGNLHSSGRWWVDLFDPDTLTAVGGFGIEGEAVLDVWVERRDEAYFVTGGGLFRVLAGQIHALDATAPAQRFERIAHHSSSGRFLVSGTGGYTLLAADGERLGGWSNGGLGQGPGEFSLDGHVLDGSAHSIRILDAPSGRPISAMDQPAAWLSGGNRLACATRERLVLQGYNRPPHTVLLQAQ